MNIVIQERTKNKKEAMKASSKVVCMDDRQREGDRERVRERMVEVEVN